MADEEARERAHEPELARGRVNRKGAAQIEREPDVQHLAPLARLGPRRARSVRPWREAPSAAARAHPVCVPSRDRASGSGPAPAARHAEHRAHQEERVPGNVRVDQRFRPLRIEVSAVMAVDVMLGVEVVDRSVAGSPPSSSSIEPRGRGVGQSAPAASRGADLSEQPLGPLRRARERGRRVLLKSVLVPAQRLRRKPSRLTGCPSSGLQSHEDEYRAEPCERK